MGVESRVVMDVDGSKGLSLSHRVDDFPHKPRFRRICKGCTGPNAVVVVLPGERSHLCGSGCHIAHEQRQRTRQHAFPVTPEHVAHSFEPGDLVAVNQHRCEKRPFVTPRQMNQRRPRQQVVQIARIAVKEARGKRVERGQMEVRSHGPSHASHWWTGKPLLCRSQ